MKQLLQYLLLLFLFSCTFNPPETSQPKSGQLFKKSQTIENKGKYVTSANELRVLFIYAMFSDDKLQSSGWELNKSILPNWGKDIVNSGTEIDFPKANLTQYFYEMSNGKFMLYGDVYPQIMVPNKNQSEYKNITEVNSEILKRIDKEVDFSKYDNWSKDKSGKYINQPDGKVDMIFILYNTPRRLFNAKPSSFKRF